MKLDAYLKWKRIKRKDFGALCGVSGGMVSHVANETKSCPLELAIRIELVTGGSVPVEDLRSDVDLSHIRYGSASASH